MKKTVFAALAVLICCTGCERKKIERVEWPVMGTIAAVQVRGAFDMNELPVSTYRKSVQKAFAEVERLMNAHNPESELCRMAAFSEDEILARSEKVKIGASHLSVRTCCEAAFKLMKTSGGAFNPRWRGANTLDLGAIAKGFALDVAAESTYVDGNDVLVDLGGNVKVLKGEGGSHGPWTTGVKNPNADGMAATVELAEGESLATSATYFRGGHIYDGRTGKPVANGVASVTVLCDSAMWADGLSTTLFILGPEEGCAFLDEHLHELVGNGKVAVLWILSDGGNVARDPEARFKMTCKN